MKDIDIILKYRRLTRAASEMGIDETRLWRIRNGKSKPVTKEELRLINNYAERLKSEDIVDRGYADTRKRTKNIFNQMLMRPLV